MICKLCLQEKPLLKKSHIAPNFLYKELRDVNNSFVRGNLDTVTSQKAYTGLFEANILCADCDNVQLSRLEAYAHDILYVGKGKGLAFRNEITPDGVEWVFCEGVDYTKFKLFLISLIWRFSISSNEFYRFVDLGEHENVIRKMIIENDPGEVTDYPCTITTYRRHEDLPRQIISQPLKHFHEGITCYAFLMNGLLFTFYISRTETPDYIKEIVVNKKNQLKVIQMPKQDAIKIIRKFMALPN
jgi:hypothetical protein